MVYGVGVCDMMPLHLGGPNLMGMAEVGGRGGT